MKIPIRLILFPMLTALLPANGISQEEEKESTPTTLSFDFEKVAVVYIHPRELKIANHTLNPFTNVEAKVDFDLAERIESLAARKIKEQLEIDALTSSEIGFRMIVPYTDSGKNYKPKLKKLEKLLLEHDCDAALIIRSYPFHHTKTIGEPPEGIGFYRNRLPGKKDEKTFLLGNLEAIVFSPSEHRHLTGKAPFIEYGIHAEIDLSDVHWPIRRKQLSPFLEEEGISILTEHLEMAADFLVSSLDPEKEIDNESSTGFKAGPKRRWLD